MVTLQNGLKSGHRCLALEHRCAPISMCTLFEQICRSEQLLQLTEIQLKMSTYQTMSLPKVALSN